MTTARFKLFELISKIEVHSAKSKIKVSLDNKTKDVEPLKLITDNQTQTVYKDQSNGNK